MFISPRRLICSRSALLAVAMLPAFSVSGGQRLARCCVWRVTNAKAPCYLVGSIHALSEKDYPLPAPYEIALNQSARIAFEFDPRRHREFERKFEAAGKYPPGRDLRSSIDPKLLAWLRQNLVTIKTAPSRRKQPRLAAFDSQLRYRAWWIAQHLVGPAIYTRDSAACGLDNYFLKCAKKSGKQIAGLESVDEHVAVMGGLSDRDSEFILRDALKRAPGAARELQRMRAAWRRGDTAALWVAAAQMRKQAPQIAARFVEERNLKWLPRIEAELESGKPTAIVAGALHFAGPRSIVRLLENRGYQIKQL